MTSPTLKRRSDRHAMVVLSGGQDSATCLLWAMAMYGKVSAVTFDYGQRHRVEIDAALNIAHKLGIDHEIVDITGLLRSTSPLVDRKAQLETYTDPASMAATIGDRVELTFVPLRNPVFLMIAANYAVAAGAAVLVTGVCAEDNANYPDCTGEFVESITATIRGALGQFRTDFKGERFDLQTPLLYKTKRETVELAMTFARGEEIMALTHTCYAGQTPPCGKCHACVLRAQGFAEAGVADPLVRATTGVGEPWPA